MPLSPRVRRQAQVRVYRRQREDPHRRPLKIFTLDSTTARTDGSVATIEVPWEPLVPGPGGAIFFVDPRDGEDDNAGVDLDDPHLLIKGGVEPSVSDPRFHQQMTYAVCSKVYAQFQQALGRIVAWGFDASTERGRLRLRPHAPELGANAEYDREHGQLSFGYFRAPATGAGRIAPDGYVFTCLSHDIIAHEFTHALVDGLRAHFSTPTSMDVMGFHEGFADLVAIFQHFTYGEMVEEQIRKLDGELTHASLLSDMAMQLGEATTGKALRQAIGPTSVRYAPGLEAHDMGTVLLSAVVSAFTRVYERKVEPFVRLAYRPPSGSPTSELVTFLASKASSLASQFLDMCIRAIDYCPPVDIQLGEFLRAMITVDRDLVPADPWGYRDALIAAFAEHGIYPPGVNQLSEDSLVWRAPLRFIEPCRELHYRNLGFAGDPSLPADADELERQAEALYAFVTRPHVADEFGLAPAGFPGADLPCVESIRTTRRIGPDGEVLFDLVAEISQSRDVADPVNGFKSKFHGGCTAIFGPEGEIRYIISKNVMNAGRLERQLTFQRELTHWAPGEDGWLKMRGFAHQLAHGGRRDTASR